MFVCVARGFGSKAIVRDAFVFSPGAPPVKVDPNGEFAVEQMYVQYVKLQISFHDVGKYLDRGCFFFDVV